MKQLHIDNLNKLADYLDAAERIRIYLADPDAPMHIWKLRELGNA